jgi:hypothetical protein
VTDNWPTIEPYFNETGSNSPSVLPSYQQRELLELAVKSCKALGLQIGVFHVEGKYTSRGPRLIEVNCRMVRLLGKAGPNRGKAEDSTARWPLSRASLLTSACPQRLLGVCGLSQARLMALPPCPCRAAAP